MKAAVCYEFGQPLTIEDVEIDALGKNEVKVRVAATAICHSDLHIMGGDLREVVKLPIVGGHETSGYVEEVGDSVTVVKPGDAVVVSMLSSCGHCYHCNIGLPHLCDASMPEMKPRLHNRKGEGIFRMTNTATFAEYAYVHESQVALLPPSFPMDRAALLGCGVITGFGAVTNLAQVKPNQSVAVIGSGGVGINTLQGAYLSGAYPIMAIDIIDRKLQVARTFGASHTINSKETDPIKAVYEITSGKGADYVFVTVGSASAIQTGVKMCGKRGMTIIVGLTPLKDLITFSPHEFGRTEKKLTGCYMGSSRLKVDVSHIIELYQAGRYKLDELISGRYPLSQINQAIADVSKSDTLRNLIIF